MAQLELVSAPETPEWFWGVVEEWDGMSTALPLRLDLSRKECEVIAQHHRDEAAARGAEVTLRVARMRGR